MGHSYMICLVLFCQTLVYREVTALFSLKNAESKTDTLSLDHNNKQQGRDPWSKTLNWYFFATTNYFLYGESIIYYFKVRHAASGRISREANVDANSTSYLLMPI
jgi:phosphatidate cytidylyltransferase